MALDMVLDSVELDIVLLLVPPSSFFDEPMDVTDVEKEEVCLPVYPPSSNVVAVVAVVAAVVVVVAVVAVVVVVALCVVSRFFIDEVATDSSA